MDKIKGFARSSMNVGCDVVEWRRSTLSSIYLMFVNGLFWFTVFYARREHQEQLLLSLASAFLIAESFSVLFSLKPIQYARDVKNDYQDWRNQSGWDQFLHFLRYLVTLGPIRLILMPPVRHLFSLLRNRFPELCIFASIVTSYSFILEKDEEKAVWAAYTTVLVALGTPPWRSNDVSGKIYRVTSTNCEILYRRVLHPTYKFLKYYLCGEWIPPLMIRLRRGYANFTFWLQHQVIDPLVRGVITLWSWTTYIFLGKWIPPLLRWIRHQILRFCNWFYCKILAPIGRGILWVWNVVTYIVLLKWVPPLCRWVYARIIHPIMRAALWLWDCFLYIILFRWVPPLLHWFVELRERGIVKLKETANYFKEQIEAGIQAALDYVRQTYLDFAQWCKDCANAAKEYIIQCLIATKLYIKNEILIPTRDWIIQSLRDLKRFILRRIIGPSLRYLWSCVHGTCIWVHETFVVPSWFYSQVWLRRSKHFAYVHYIQPALHWIYEQLPDKSVFVDDSDTELKDFLPYDEQSGIESHGRTPKKSAAHSRHDSECSEENEIRQGLQFGDIVDSDSSDEEFSLRQRRPPTNSRRKNTQQSAITDKQQPKSPSPVKLASADTRSSQEEDLVVRKAEKAKKTVLDEDDFELVDPIPDIT